MNIDGVEVRETVDPEGFKELVRQKFLLNNPQYTDKIANVLAKDGGDFYKKNIEKYYHEIEDARKSRQEEEELHKKGYSVKPSTLFVVGKDQKEDSNESLSIKIYNRQEQESKGYKIVEEIPVKKDDVKEETMKELESIGDEIQMVTKEIALNLADTAR
ncbi:MAG TPA: hypothetical protein PLD77_02415 [Candidatus Dojkabacteria bacterium]|jgi:hypothetical protein|nr:hypothetical protein [Candidatus Dojkabacteria bacterium]